jgi:hypothetical protein
MIRPSPLILVLFATISAWLCAGAVAQTTYKYLDANGKTVYSDHAPPAGVKFTTIEAKTKPTGVDVRPSEANVQDAATAERDRRARQGEHEQLIAGAKQSYESAVRELEAAKEPQEGERQHNANGTSHLTEDYQKRIAPLEQKVEEMKRKLEEAERS